MMPVVGCSVSKGFSRLVEWTYVQLRLSSVRQPFGALILLLVALTAFGGPRRCAARPEAQLSKKEWLITNGALASWYAELAKQSAG